MIRVTESAPFVAIEYTYEVEKILYKKKSKFQDIMVFENPYFGKILTLDGVVQITERDEFFYHEMLTHPVLHAPRTLKKWLSSAAETAELSVRSSSTRVWRNVTSSR